MALTDWGSSSLWSTFSDMERMLDDFNRAFGRSRRGRAFLGQVAPPMNIWTKDDELVVTCEVPGVDPETLGITVMGDIVTVRGRRSFDQETGHAKSRTEKKRTAGDGDDGESYSEFSRSLQLPFRVDPDRTEARCRNGVLAVSMHRPEAEKPKRVAISAS